MFPGLLAAVTVAIAAQFLSEHYYALSMPFALLFGMGFHYLSEAGSRGPGTQFASKTILKFSVALLDLGLTIDQILAVSWGVVEFVITRIIVTMPSSPLLTRIMN